MTVGGRLQRAWLRRGTLAWLLRPLSWVFASLAALRRALFALGWLRREGVPVPVVVVGNVVAGGAGKTPVVLAITRHFQARGLTVGIVSRGHGRSTDDCREVLDDSDPAEVGDEPLLLRRATGAPVAAYAGFPVTAVRFPAGPPTEFASAPGVRRGFCGRCGSPISFVGERWPGEIHLHLGSFNDSSDLAPAVEAFTEERLPVREGWQRPREEISGFSLASDVVQLALRTPEKFIGMPFDQRPFAEQAFDPLPWQRPPIWTPPNYPGFSKRHFSELVGRFAKKALPFRA